MKKNSQKQSKTVKKQQNMKISNFLLLPILFLTLSCSNQKEKNTFGFAGDRENTWVVGSPESVSIWKQWCELHSQSDVEGITNLASDSIRIDAPGGEFTIDGKKQLTSFLTDWFDNNKVNVSFGWGVPLKFINQEGNPIDGDWITSGFSLEVDNGTETTVEENHANIYIENGKIQYFRVFQHKVSNKVSVTFSVDLSSYEGDFESVGVFGSFNGWCGTCNPMTDDDGDGVYTATIKAVEGELQYKFVLDGQSVEESFESGEPCTTTIDIYTNRVMQVKGNMILDPVCFDSCSNCK